MSDFVKGIAMPSGTSVKFDFGSYVNFVSNGNAVQQLIIVGAPSGGDFTLTFGGDTTASITPTVTPPYGSITLSMTLTPGNYDIATNLTKGGPFEPDAEYNIFDVSTLLQTTHLNQAGDSGFAGGVTNPTPFADTTSPTPLKVGNSGGATVQWYPIATNLNLPTGALSIRVSGSAAFPGSTILCVDNYRIVPHGGGSPQFLTCLHPTSGGAEFDPGTGQQVFPEPDSSSGLAGPSTGNGPRYLVDPADVQAKFTALASVGSGNATFTGNGTAQTPLTWQYVGALAGAVQAVPVASDATNVQVSQVTAGGLLPELILNGGSPVPVPSGWIVWEHGGQMPTVFVFPPVCCPDPGDPRTYGVIGHYWNTNVGSPPAPFNNGSDGSWQLGGGGYYGQTWSTAGSTPTCTWHFGPWKAATYRLSATYPASGGQSTSVTFTVKDLNGTTLGTHTVDQTVAPSHDTDQGVTWEVLGTYTLTGDSAGAAGFIIVQSNGTSSTMVANAIRFERTSSDDTFRIAPIDTVTATWGAGWVTTVSGGPVAAQASPLTLINIVGGQLVTTPTASHSCEIGYNTPEPASNVPTLIYNDLMALSNDVVEAWPTVLPASSHVFGVNTVPISWCADGKAWPNIPPGNYILRWKGAGDCHVTSSGPPVTETGTATYPATSGSQNQRQYTFGGNPGCWGAEISLQVYGTSIIGSGPTYNSDVTDVHIYPAGTDLASPAKYRAEFLARSAAMKSRRFLDGLGVIDGNPTIYSDYNPPQSNISKNSALRDVRASIASIQDYTGTMTGTQWNLNRARGAIFLVTCTAPHSFSNFQHFYFSPECDAVGVMQDGSNPPLNFAFANYNAFIYVVDDTRFVFQLFYASLNALGTILYTNAHMQNVVTNPAGVVYLINVGSGQPLQDLVEICNINGENFYFNTSYCSTIAALESCATYIANNLDSGRKLRVECMNETWQQLGSVYTISSANSYALYGGDAEDDIPFKCQLANQQWTAMKAAWVAAGRDAGDFIRVMGSQWGNAGVTSSIVTYCLDNGLDFGDEVAIAPYLSCAASITRAGPDLSPFGAILNRMTVEQTLDKIEDYFVNGGYEGEVAAHLGRITPSFPGVTLIFYEYSPESMEIGGAFSPNGPRDNHAIARHPRWLAMDQHIMQVYIASGCRAIHRFVQSQTENANCYVWPVYNFTAELPYTPSPTQDAIQIQTPDRMDLIQSVMGASMDATAARFNSTPSSTATGTASGASSASGVGSSTSSGMATGTATGSSTASGVGASSTTSPSGSGNIRRMRLLRRIIG